MTTGLKGFMLKLMYCTVKKGETIMLFDSHHSKKFKYLFFFLIFIHPADRHVIDPNISQPNISATCSITTFFYEYHIFFNDTNLHST